MVQVRAQGDCSNLVSVARFLQQGERGLLVGQSPTSTPIFPPIVGAIGQDAIALGPCL